jgi:hypothetical protein
MAKLRITLALTAWLFAWACWSFVIAQLIGGHAFRGGTSSRIVELAQNRDAVYAGALRTQPGRPTMRYIRGEGQAMPWEYLIHLSGPNEWPRQSGFHFVAQPTLKALRIPWWFVLGVTGTLLAISVLRARRGREGQSLEAVTVPPPTTSSRMLPYALPDMSGRLERRLRVMTVACSAICILITIGDTLNGPRAHLPGWIDLVQVLAAMAATLAAANLLASPGFRGRRRRVVMLALGCFVALIVRLVLPQLSA